MFDLSTFPLTLTQIAGGPSAFLCLRKFPDTTRNTQILILLFVFCKDLCSVEIFSVERREKKTEGRGGERRSRERRGKGKLEKQCVSLQRRQGPAAGSHWGPGEPCQLWSSEGRIKHFHQLTTDNLGYSEDTGL